MGELLNFRSSGGAAEFGRSLRDKMGRGARLGDVLGAVGHRLALTTIPLSLRRNESGARVPRRGGRPLMDSGRLANSIAYRATNRSLRVGTNVPYARIHNRGGTIRPRFAKKLLVPLSPPLSRSEARAFPHGRAAIRARFPGSFYLHGPQGEGLYRKTSSRRGKLHGIERFAAAVDHIAVRRTDWLTWRPAWRQDARKTVLGWYASGKLAGGVKPASGGNPDTGGKS